MIRTEEQINKLAIDNLKAPLKPDMYLGKRYVQEFEKGYKKCLEDLQEELSELSSYQQFDKYKDYGK